MAHQDVRYYLNGLLLEITGKTLRTVATDGHRLALSERTLEIEPIAGNRQLIVPRKGVAEIQRLASHVEGPLTLGLSSNALRVSGSGQTVTVKLVDGKFPDYERVIPRNGDKTVVSHRETLRAALQR
ncbi:MAG: DNA polymerase III subunit beta, partial [bacterium]